MDIENEKGKDSYFMHYRKLLNIQRAKERDRNSISFIECTDPIHRGKTTYIYTNTFI